MTYIQINKTSEEYISKKIAEERAKAEKRLAEKEQKLRERAKDAEEKRLQSAEKNQELEKAKEMLKAAQDAAKTARDEVVRLKKVIADIRPRRARMPKDEKQAALQDAIDKVAACLNGKDQMAKSAIIKRTKLSPAAVGQALKSKSFKKVGKGRNTNWSLK